MKEGRIEEEGVKRDMEGRRRRGAKENWNIGVGRTGKSVKLVKM